ncbi:MAG: succinate dehydrogenase assembly factor 2 [Gammaproteobacteria bacterium]
MTAQNTESKLRWQSRRGTLELDLLLHRYWQKTPPSSSAEKNALAELLALDDEDLMRAVGGGADSLHLSQPARQLAAMLAG